MKCINVANALEAPNEGEWGYVIREKDFDLIRNAGFDTVRLPVKWSAHAGETAPFTIEPAFLSRVIDVVRQAEARNLRVILDVHHYDEINTDPAGHADRLLGIWRQIFDAFSGPGHEGVIFEFLNEPNQELTAPLVAQLNSRLLAELRLTQPDRWAILAAAGWTSIEGMEALAPPSDDHVIATFHFYEPYEFTHQGAEWASPPPPIGTRWGSEAEHRRVMEVMNRAAATGARLGVPVLLGEFGVILHARPDDRAIWTRFVRRMAEQRGLGWCAYDWTGAFPVYDREAEAFHTPVLKSLFD